MTPFDFLNAINDTKKDLFKEDPLAQKDYSAFMVNRGLSYFPDTIMFANEMNKNAGIPSDWQFYFYLNGVTKRKRFSKWSKKDKASDSLQVVMKHFNYSSQKAIEVLDILTDEQLKQLSEMYDTGGK